MGQHPRPSQEQPWGGNMARRRDLQLTQRERWRYERLDWDCPGLVDTDDAFA